MQQLARGVYTAPFLSEALEAVIISIDSQGRRINEKSVPSGQSPTGIIAELRQELDQKDPALTPV
jgi:hypothetical protein